MRQSTVVQVVPEYSTSGTGCTRVQGYRVYWRTVVQGALELPQYTTSTPCTTVLSYSLCHCTTVLPVPLYHTLCTTVLRYTLTLVRRVPPHSDTPTCSTTILRYTPGGTPCTTVLRYTLYHCILAHPVSDHCIQVHSYHSAMVDPVTLYSARNTPCTTVLVHPVPLYHWYTLYHCTPVQPVPLYFGASSTTVLWYTLYQCTLVHPVPMYSGTPSNTVLLTWKKLKVNNTDCDSTVLEVQGVPECSGIGCTRVQWFRMYRSTGVQDVPWYYRVYRSTVVQDGPEYSGTGCTRE